MLTLGRNAGESIMIGDNITITILEVRCGKVRIGIDAPREVPIMRQELGPRRDSAPEPADAAD
jgi:carbon storage regulator